MDRNYKFTHLDGRVEWFTRDQIVENAKFQRDQGVEPLYSYNYGHGEYSEPGYLVLSGRDGATVCRLLDNGNAHIIQAWQGDFVLMLGEVKRDGTIKKGVA